jgi:hypothetical protein
VRHDAAPRLARARERRDRVRLDHRTRPRAPAAAKTPSTMRRSCMSGPQQTQPFPRRVTPRDALRLGVRPVLRGERDLALVVERQLRTLSSGSFSTQVTPTSSCDSCSPCLISRDVSTRSTGRARCGAAAGPIAASKPPLLDLTDNATRDDRAVDLSKPLAQPGVGSASIRRSWLAAGVARRLFRSGFESRRGAHGRLGARSSSGAGVCRRRPFASIRGPKQERASRPGPVVIRGIAQTCLAGGISPVPRQRRLPERYGASQVWCAASPATWCGMPVSGLTDQVTRRSVCQDVTSRRANTIAAAVTAAAT